MSDEVNAKAEPARAVRKVPARLKELYRPEIGIDGDFVGGTDVVMFQLLSNIQELLQRQLDVKDSSSS